MASKTITGTTSNENISSRMVCSSTSNIDGNYSLVTIVGQLSRTNTGYTTYGDGTFYIDITVGGTKTTYSATGYKEITYNSNTEVVAARSIKVPHASDGSRTITVAFRGSMPGTTLSSITCSGTFTLDTIPRASKITANSSVNAGDSLSVTITPAVSTFTHTATLIFGSKSVSKTNVITSTTLATSLDWLNEIPNASSGVATLTVITYNGSTKIGTTTMQITINAPSSAAPTVSVAGITAINQFNGMYLKTISQVRISLTAAGLYGAGISSYKIVGGGFSGTTNPYTTPALQQAGSYGFVCTVTDTRGLSTTITTDEITVEDYRAPSYVTVSAQRSDANGDLDINGTYIKALADISYTDLGGTNTIAINVKYRQVGKTLYSDAVALDNNVAQTIGGGSILINEMWDVHFDVTDTVGNAVSYDLVIARSDYVLTMGRHSMGFLLYTLRSGINFPALSDYMTYFGDTPITDIFVSYDAEDALSKLQGILPVSHGGLGAASFAAALGLTLVASSVSPFSGANAAGSTATVTISSNFVYLVIAWSHAAISGIVSAAFISYYSAAGNQSIVQGSHAPTISVSGSKISITRASYRFNYIVLRIGA